MAEADVLVINTCTVTEAADREGRRFVRQMVSRLGPGRVVVTGCSSQRDPAPYAAIAGVRLVTGNANKERLREVLLETQNAWADAVPIVLHDLSGSSATARVRTLATNGNSSHARAYLRVQDGCNQKCTYCTLPGVRGSSASVPLDQIVLEAGKLEDAGHGELVLTGAHLGSYGYDLEPRRLLPTLISAILRAAPRARIRLSSLEPRFISEGLLELLTHEPRLCPHLHLPLQSGSDRILAAMKRAYRVDPFRRKAIAAAQAAQHRFGEGVPGLALGSDFIVGFPGEDDAAFASTMELVDRLPFTYGHVFPYSNRPGTPAAELQDQVSPEIIRRRGRALRGLLAEKGQAYRRGMVGQQVEIVAERIAKRASGYQITGMSEQFVKVQAVGEGTPPSSGSRIPVIVTDLAEKALEARVLESTQVPLSSQEISS